jgi:hypothetical protein
MLPDEGNYIGGHSGIIMAVVVGRVAVIAEVLGGDVKGWAQGKGGQYLPLCIHSGLGLEQGP